MVKQKIKNLIKRFLPSSKVQKKEWKDIEYFDTAWMNRTKTMASYIPVDKTVLDLGCGQMWLKNFLKMKAYYPVDYKKRGDETIVCNFNKHEFPNVNTDYVFVAGCMEYVVDFEWFVKQIVTHSNNCVISYCCLEEFPDLDRRRGLTWVNNLSKNDLIKLFTSNGMTLIAEDECASNSIFVFSKNS